LDSEKTYFFKLLKKEVIAFYLKTHSAPSSVERWSKEDIISFQEALFEKVNTKVSEKWFYTYFKNSPTKLPRIDMLNLLSQYLDYSNWSEFKSNNSKKKKTIYAWFILFIIALVTFSFLVKTENKFHFCFIDDDKGEVVSTHLGIEILNENETPIYLQTNANGCFDYTTKKDEVTFLVKSEYYKTDTIVRHIDNLQGNIRLKVDDYALMLDYYSKGSIKNVNLRKKQLNQLIDEDAIIYQMYSNEIGIEVYSKKEFVNLLTIPTSSLKNIHFLNKEFKNNKIVKLKFMVK
jgi:hypothetical protein